MDDRQNHPQSLQTERLRLRFVRPSDATALSTLMTEPVSRWLISWPVPFTVEMAAARIADARIAATERRMLPFAIERRSDEALLGWLSVTKENGTDRRALLSYWIGTIHHGQGYMREAVAAAIPAAFRMLDLDVIEAAAQPKNEPSRAILERCGMTLVDEQVIFAPARNRDELSVVYEIARPLPAGGTV